MKKIILGIFIFIYAITPSFMALAETDDEAAGLPPLTAKQALFTADPTDKGAETVTATDAGLASEEAGEAAYSEAGVEEVDSAMDVGMDY